MVEYTAVKLISKLEKPFDIPCPDCGQDLEYWKDGAKGKVFLCSICLRVHTHRIQKLIDQKWRKYYESNRKKNRSKLRK